MLYKFKNTTMTWARNNVDKLGHYILSQFIFVSLFSSLFIAGFSWAFLAAIVTSFAVGVIVEIVDYFSDDGHAVFSDILANTLGILTAAIPIGLVICLV